MSKSNDRKALGKGLSALLPSKAQQKSEPQDETRAASAILELELDKISANPEQPRTHFDDANLQELAQSIQANGVIQPLIVQSSGPDRYHLIAGERRWRAAQIAGLDRVPVVVRDYAKDRLLEVALIENIQREDLNPIEIAYALQRLASHHQLSHEEIARRTGKDRTTITNLIRLLKLPRDIQALVVDRRLSMGHARALLGLEDEQRQVDLAQRAAAQGLSVRQVERLVQSVTATRQDPQGKTAAVDARPGKDPNVEAATRDLEATLGTRVRIVPASPDRGKIEIDYFSIDELDRIYNLITTRN